MTAIGMSLMKAAKVANVTEGVIVEAVKSRALVVRRVKDQWGTVDRDKPVIVDTDLRAWLLSLPSWKDPEPA